MTLDKIRKADRTGIKEAIEQLIALSNDNKLTVGEHSAMISTIRSRGEQLGMTIEDLNNIFRDSMGI